jgi:hypothetical protein
MFIRGSLLSKLQNIGLGIAHPLADEDTWEALLASPWAMDDAGHIIGDMALPAPAAAAPRRNKRRET